MKEKEIDEMNDFNCKRLSVTLKHIEESYNLYNNEGFVGKTEQMNDCMAETKLKNVSDNSFDKGGLIDKTDQMDDRMFKANHVIIDKLEETEEVDKIDNSQKHPTSNEFKQVISGETVEKLDTIDSITITQCTIFVSGEDIDNDHEKEREEDNIINNISMIKSDEFEDTKEFSVINTFMTDSKIYR